MEAAQHQLENGHVWWVLHQKYAAANPKLYDALVQADRDKAWIPKADLPWARQFRTLHWRIVSAEHELRIDAIRFEFEPNIHYRRGLAEQPFPPTPQCVRCDKPRMPAPSYFCKDHYVDLDREEWSWTQHGTRVASGFGALEVVLPIAERDADKTAHVGIQRLKARRMEVVWYGWDARNRLRPVHTLPTVTVDAHDD